MRRNRNYAIQRKWNFHYLQAKSRKAFFYVVVHYTSKGLGSNLWFPGQKGNVIKTTCLKTCLVSKSGFLFHRFFGNTNKWICRILEFRKKFLSLGRNFLSLEGKSRGFIVKNCIFCLIFSQNCRIFEFSFEICLSLAKNS